MYVCSYLSGINTIAFFVKNTIQRYGIDMDRYGIDYGKKFCDIVMSVKT